MARVESAWTGEAQFMTNATPDPDPPDPDPDPDPEPPVDPEHLTVARLPLEIINPKSSGWNSWNRYLWAHSQMEYAVPIGVLGGKPPFTFAISGITGATVTGVAPTWNPKMVSAAVVTIPANTGGTWTVTVTDMDSTTDSVTISVTVNDSMFVFIDPAGDDGNDGSHDSPKQTFAHIWGTGLSTTPHSGKTLVMRAGSYIIPATGDDSDQIHWHQNKPRSIIGYPGEAAILDGRSSGPTRGFSNGISGVGELRDMHETLWQNITLRGNGTWFFIRNNTSHCVWHDVTFLDVDGSLVGTDDHYGIFMTETGDHQNWSAVGVTFDNCNGAGNSKYYGVFLSYSANTSWDMVETVNSSSLAYSFSLRYANQHTVITSQSVWTDALEQRGPAYHLNDGTIGDHPLGTVTSSTSILQLRYCRFFMLPPDSGQGQDLDTGCALLDYDTDDAYGQAHLDRSVVVLGIKPQEDPNRAPATANVSGCMVLNNKGYWGVHIPTWYNVSDTQADYYKDSTWQNWIDTDGRILTGTGLRYQIGWEV